jgi:hypothetical protein
VEHVKEKGGTFNTMSATYGVIRSFFYHARAELPRISVQFTPTRDASVGKLNLETFKVFLKASSLRDQAVYLSLFQGMMDQERFFSVFNLKGFELGEHIRTKGLDQPYRIDFLRGRKANRKHPFNSWISHDALEAWKLYFDSERGYPKEGEPCAIDQFGKPLSKQGFMEVHRLRQRRLGLTKGNGKPDVSSRYGFGCHELRDLARSVLEKAKSEGFNTNSAEMWMGHVVDKLFYNKIWSLDPEYNLVQYNIAEKHLNVISHVEHPDLERIVDSRIKERDAVIQQLQDRLTKLEKVYTKKLEVTAQ